jgi:hypothetical protein
MRRKREPCEGGWQTSLEIRRNKEGRVEVPNLKEKVDSIQAVMDLLSVTRIGQQRPLIRNEHSSRSHMVLHGRRPF